MHIFDQRFWLGDRLYHNNWGKVFILRNEVALFGNYIEV